MRNSSNMKAAISTRPMKSAPYLPARVLIEYTLTGCASDTSKVCSGPETWRGVDAVRTTAAAAFCAASPSPPHRPARTCSRAVVTSEDTRQCASKPCGVTSRCVARKRPPKLGCAHGERRCAVVSSAIGTIESVSWPTSESFMSKASGLPVCQAASAAPVSGAWMPSAYVALSGRPGTRWRKRSASPLTVSAGEPSRPRRSLTWKATNGGRNSIDEPLSLCGTACGSKPAKPPPSAAVSV
ncbi:hypothetical protein D9M69_461550 [compost metagenome]